MDNNKFSKEKLRNFANAFGNKTKNTFSELGEATKNAAISVSENMKESSKQLSEKMDQKKLENDKKRLCPIYKEDILSESFVLPPLVNVVTYDKRMENKACEGAVAFWSGKDAKLFNIYREFVDLLNINFYPFLEDTVYYVDPCFKDSFIKLDEYFAYLKKVRVDELASVARDLGAKHFEIVLRGNTISAQSSSASASVSGAGKIGGEASFSSTKVNTAMVEVAAKMDFSGNETPVEPKLVYFKSERDINALIKMRLDPENGNKILSQTYSLQYGNTSGIKVSDAKKIEASLSQANVSAKTSVTKEAHNESTTTLEYTISF